MRALCARIPSEVLDFSQTHFELFGLPTTFDVDAEELSERFLTLQRALHPDRFAAAGDREKRTSMQASTRVNEAYHVLKDPLSRGRYLLSLHTGEEAGENETTKDMVFLMEQMELRESLAGAGSAADPYGVVAVVIERLNVLSGQLIDELAERLDAPAEEDIEPARELIRKLQFVSKCRVEAEQVEAALDELP